MEDKRSIERWAKVRVLDALADTPVVLVHGPRQVGKSTLVREVASEQNSTYITLDDWRVLGFAREDPAGFLRSYRGAIVIDEVQRAPELLLAMKAEIDRDRRPGRFLLTGSANVLTVPKVADSLAGRMEIVDLLPLAEGERRGTGPEWLAMLLNRDPLTLPRGTAIDPVELLRGGFPEPSARSAPRRDAWFASYVRSLLERDVRDLAQIDGIAQMPRLLRSLAHANGASLNVASLSRESGIPATTLLRYLDLLRTMFLVRDLPAWSSDQGAALAKAPKLQLVDVGLWGHIIGIEERRVRNDEALRSAILRSVGILEFFKASLALPSGVRLFHLRTVRQKGVDLVVEATNGDLVGVQFRESVQRNAVEGLEFLRELAGDRFVRGVLFHAGDDRVPLAPEIEAVPVSSIL
ncbi:MAG: ATP-binding protein [Methanoregulaceae archaeon]|nr:ATP-binding protein [Methanoregulaceae archaeon]